MTADLAIIPVAGGIQDYADPAAFVELALTRAKEWLVEAIDHGDIAGIVELKSQAEAIRVYTAQKQLGKEAELNAAEIVRRAERGLGLAIRKGQAEGAFVGDVRPHNGRYTHRTADNSTVPTIREATGLGGDQLSRDIYPQADNVTDEQFDDAIAEGRDEKNLQRANVIRKVKGEAGPDKLAIARQMAAGGHTVQQIAVRLGYSRPGMREFLVRHDIDVPAERVVKGTRNLNSTRIVDAAVGTVNGIGMLFDQIVYADLPTGNVQGWLDILNESIRSLTTLRNRLKETSQP